jgi:hypothetical protein
MLPVLPSTLPAAAHSDLLFTGRLMLCASLDAGRVAAAAAAAAVSAWVAAVKRCAAKKMAETRRK